MGETVPRGKLAILVGCVFPAIVAVGCARHTAVTISQAPGLPADARPTAVVSQERVDESTAVPTLRSEEDSLANRTIDELNRDSLLKPVFFPLDGADLDSDARAISFANANLLQKYSTWIISVEGHCDERGTSEYNIALGMRRALAVKAYLVLLRVSAARIYTVSYGKEFPFIEGHTEAAWSKNRRAQLVIVSK